MEMEIFNEWKANGDFPVVLTFGAHLVLSSWSMLSTWSGNRLLIHDAILLAVLVWCLSSRKVSPVLLAILVEAISSLLDIIVLACFYPNRYNTSVTTAFSAVSAIANLAFRFCAVLVLYNEAVRRHRAVSGNGENRVEADGGEKAPFAAAVSGLFSKPSQYEQIEGDVTPGPGQSKA